MRNATRSWQAPCRWRCRPGRLGLMCARRYRCPMGRPTPARHGPVPGTARWGSGRHGTSCLPGRAEVGTVPDLWPRHGLLSRFSGQAGSISTACQGGRASPRPASAGDDGVKVEGATSRVGGIRERKGKNRRGSRVRGAARERGGGGSGCAWSHGGGLEADPQRQWPWQAQACSSHSSKKNKKNNKNHRALYLTDQSQIHNTTKEIEK